MNTIEELQELREKLLERRLVEVFRLTAYSDERIEKVAQIQAAIDAVDAVIAKGDVPPENDGPVAFFIG